MDQKKVLMIAYVFPPFFSPGGSIRAIKFIKYLPSLGWKPFVLTIDDRKETDTQRKQGSETLLNDIPSNVKIYRTSNTGEPSLEILEKGRSLRLRSRLLGYAINILRDLRQWVTHMLLLPDAHIAWLPYAVRMGRKIIKDDHIEVIWVTCPPHSAALIGAVLKISTRKPLVLDYRDDWIDTPWFKTKSPFIQRIERNMERWAIGRADRVILVTDYSRKAFLARYPRQPSEKFVLIPNGCDLEDFKELINFSAPSQDSRFKITHAGLLSIGNEWKRDPHAFFQAIRDLMVENPEMTQEMEIAFTGSLPAEYRQIIHDMQLEKVVKEVGFLQSSEFMKLLHHSDLLLTINYDGFATLIPGKIYEYWAVGGPPILLLSCPGAASDLLEKHQLGFTIDSYDVQAIKNIILEVYKRKKTDRALKISTAGLKDYDRHTLTVRLAAVLRDLA